MFVLSVRIQRLQHLQDDELKLSLDGFDLRYYCTIFIVKACISLILQIDLIVRITDCVR